MNASQYGLLRQITIAFQNIQNVLGRTGCFTLFDQRAINLLLAWKIYLFFA